MKPTGFLVLLAITAVSVAAAAYAVLSESRIQATATAPAGPLFPDLLARANDVQTVTVESAKGTFTVARTATGWVMGDKDNFPVQADKLSRLVAGLADLQLLEAKTDAPDRLARLEVEDVTAKDAKSRQVTLAGADGKPLAALILGKQNYTLDLNGLRGVYVRKLGDDQSWLAQGAVAVPATALEWLDRTVVDLPVDKVQSLNFAPTAAPAVSLARPDATKPFALLPMPEGRAADPEALQRLTASFAAVTFDDVRADKDTDKAVTAGTAEAASLDGLTLKAELLALDGGTWLRLTATAADGSPAAEAAKTITARTQGWLFKLPQFKAALLQPKVEDFLKKTDGQS